MAGTLLWLVLGISCLLPLAWLALQLISHPETWAAFRWSAFQWGLFGRTSLYNAAAAVLAVTLALPAAIVIGRGRGSLARCVLILLPLTAMMPSLTYTYGWVQVLRLLDIQPQPAGPADVLRCIWTIASWLWAIPAIGIGLSLRLMDSQIQQQALSDGALYRVTWRALLPSILASTALVMVLAVQEFGVYERSGISVIATELRTLFETGSVGASSSAIAAVTPGAAREAGPDLAQRAASAVATAVPMLTLLALLTLAALAALRRVNASETLEINAWPPILDAGLPLTLTALFLILLTFVLPTAAMVYSMSRPLHPVNIWAALGPHAAGSLLVGLLTGVFALLVAALTCLRVSRTLLIASLISFIIGGELLAISNIRLYNPLSGHTVLGWIYNHVPIMVIACLGRFAWVAMLAGHATWGRSFQDLREMASLDGASPARAAMHVIGPIAWPVLLASGLLVMILSMTEIGATVLLAPQRPQMLVPLLMTWVHMLRYDDMLEGSLLLIALVFVLGLGFVMLIWLGTKVAASLQKPAVASRTLLVLPALLLLGAQPQGCSGGGGQPDAVVGATGVGRMQFIYPRAITYSRADDTYYTIDRMARVQRLDADLKYLNEWRMPDWEKGKPVGVSVGPDGNVYVADTHYYRVVVYTPHGQEVRRWGTEGRGPGQFTYPTDIAFDAGGHVYVSEYGDNDRIQVFAPQGKYLREFGSNGNGDGQFNRPESMVIDGELLYVTDSCNHRIVVFKTDGTWLRNMGKIGSNPGEFRWPYGMEMNSRGQLVIAEFGNNRVQLIDKETGKGLATWGLAGREPGQLAYPWAVAVGKKDQVVVVDSGNNRLQVFRW